MEMTHEDMIDNNITLLNGLVVQASIAVSVEERKRKLVMAQRTIANTLALLSAE